MKVSGNGANVVPEQKKLPTEPFLSLIATYSRRESKNQMKGKNGMLSGHT